MEYMIHFICVLSEKKLKDSIRQSNDSESVWKHQLFIVIKQKYAITEYSLALYFQNVFCW